MSSAARCRRCSALIISRAGEAILTASVLAEFDQFGRVAHRAHHGVELVDAVAMPVREHRHVAAREGRLLMRDRVQRHGRIGDDARAVIRARSRGACRRGRRPRSLRSSIRCAAAPIWLWGSSAMPCASKLRWSMRASMSSSASRSLAISAQCSRQRSTISVRFQSRTFGPKPFSSTARMVSMTWACGLALPSSAMSQCTLRSAICLDRRIRTARSRGRVRCPASATSRAEGRIQPRGQAVRPS